MKTHNAFYAILLVLSSCTTQGQSDLQGLHKFLKTQEDSGFCGAVFLIEDDSIIFNQGYGYANRELKIPIGTETIFPYGSIVKDYTKTAVLLLASEGKLSLDDPIDMYLDDLPLDKKQITIGHLIQHKSGLHPYHDQNHEANKKWPGIPGDFIPMSKEQCLDYIYSQELLFKPGEEFSYSNSGYTLLALIVEQVTNQNFEEVIRERILDPAGMKNTDFYNSGLWEDNEVAIGYGPQSYGEKNSPFYWPRNPYPLLGNGGMAGTLYDFYLGIKYMENLKKENQEFLTLANNSNDVNLGMPEDIIGSAGGNDFGFVSVIFGLKSKDQYMIFSSNNDQDGVEDMEMISTILRLGLGFDLSRLMPSNENEDNSEPIEGSPKWNLPDKQHWNRASLLLDLLESQNENKIISFVELNCTSKFLKSKSEQEHIQFFQELMKMVPIEINGAEYATPVIKLKLKKGNSGATLEIQLSKDNSRLIDRIIISPAG